VCLPAREAGRSNDPIIVRRRATEVLDQSTGLQSLDAEQPSLPETAIGKIRRIELRQEESCQPRKQHKRVVARDRAEVVAREQFAAEQFVEVRRHG